MPPKIHRTGLAVSSCPEGNIGLWFRQRSRQLVGSYNAPQMKFYGPPARDDGEAA